jgi:hypothetical protein
MKTPTHSHAHSLTSQGPVVNSEDLAEALEQGEIFGAGLDVITGEPNISPDHPLVKAKNCEWGIVDSICLSCCRPHSTSRVCLCIPSILVLTSSPNLSLWSKRWISSALYTFLIEL